MFMFFEMHLVNPRGLFLLTKSKLITRDGDTEVIVDSDTHEVKEIEDHRTQKNGKMSYYVIWKDSCVEPSWVSVEDFDDVQVI